MTDETKSFILLNLEILKGSLNEAGIIVGAMVDKNNPNNTKLVFLDKQKYLNGERDGFTMEFDELNKP